jgi:hypothetical protein
MSQNILIRLFRIRNLNILNTEENNRGQSGIGFVSIGRDLNGLVQKRASQVEKVEEDLDEKVSSIRLDSARIKSQFG